MVDLAAFSIELEWLKKNPAFEQRPATIIEFLGPDYLAIESRIRPGLRSSLIRIFGDRIDGNLISRVRRAMVTGGIGIGKTTFASIAIPYMVHWVSCLKDPQEFFSLLPGSRIAFMLMSTTDAQAKQVLFGDIKARIQHSPWFKANALPDKDFKNQLRFPKEIWVLPGNSQETTFEGYNILGGILDEGDSHKQLKDKDFAEAGYDTMHSRIDSRFNDPDAGDHMGLIIVIGQMKKGSGFMAKKKRELETDRNAYVVHMSIWESIGWDKFTDDDGNRKSFFYDVRRKQIVPKGVIEQIGIENNDLIEVPDAYRKNFENNPEKALRDLAGIPPAADSPFISLVDRIDECTERWAESHTDELGNVLVPVGPDPTHPNVAPWLHADNALPRVVHIDIAISGEGDALGLAMGHISELVEIDNELKPYIVFDFLFRMKATPGTEIMLADIRRIIYELKDERNFRIKKVTMDGFQSVDTRQQLSKRRIPSDYLSVDRNLAPYYDLKEAIYERRIEFPPYMTYLNRGDTSQIEITKKELRELSEQGNKVDHPTGGSKDVADCLAGVTHTLMFDRQFRRVAPQPDRSYSETPEPQSTTPVAYDSDPLSRILAGLGRQAPIPPSISSLGGDILRTGGTETYR